MDTRLTPVLKECLAHLHCEFAGRHHNERKRDGGIVSVDPVQNRQCEGCGLAGARRCLAKHVAALKHQRDCLALDRGRFFVTKAGQGSQKCWLEAKVAEAVDARFLRRFLVGGVLDSRLRVDRGFVVLGGLVGWLLLGSGFVGCCRGRIDRSFFRSRFVLGDRGFWRVVGRHLVGGRCFVNRSAFVACHRVLVNRGFFVCGCVNDSFFVNGSFIVIRSFVIRSFGRRGFVGGVFIDRSFGDC